jgi:hypothetical protein
MLDRTPRIFASTRGALLGLAAAMLVVIALPVGGLAFASHNSHTDQARLDAETANPHPCRGAVAVVDLDNCATDAPADVIPAVGVSADDVVPIARTEPCLSPPGTTGTLGICELREGDGLRVAMVGDSHIHSIIPVGLAFADEYDWSLTEVHKAACTFSEASRDISPEEQRLGCVAWNQSTREWLAEQKFDLVMITQRQDVAWLAEPGKSAEQTAVDGLVDAWESVVDTGARLLVVKDNPLPIDENLSCLELAAGNLEDACTLPVEDALKWDVQVPAFAAIDDPDVAFVDLDDAYCWDGSCRAVAGGAQVYRDRDGHITATWARSLAPVIADRVPDGFLTDPGANTR